MDYYEGLLGEASEPLLGHGGGVGVWGGAYVAHDVIVIGSVRARWLLKGLMGR